MEIDGSFYNTGSCYRVGKKESQNGNLDWKTDRQDGEMEMAG